ncbi:MAG: hypothetical protein HKN23_03635 [Verrucomicrobiales bacterium]|nr:hypothetical protein [Verrucomicrobiales bacterium]
MIATLRNWTVIFAGILITAGQLAQAQVYTPPTQNPGAGNNGGGGTNNTTVVNQGSQNQGNQRVVGNDVPFLDPTTETFLFDGKAFNVNDNRLFRSRFEKYLNSAEATSEMDLQYRKSIRSVLDALSPHGRERGVNYLAIAVANLQHAAEFPQDSRLCESLANAVYRVFLARNSVHSLQELNQDLDMQRRKLDWNFDAWKDSKKLNTGRKLSSDPNAAQNNQATNPENAGHLQRYIQRIAEVEAERVANKAKMELSEVEAKLEFQALIVQLFLQRRFEHVIMGTRLYTEFFQDGDGRLQFQQGSEVAVTFGTTIGFDPTITTLDTFANEAIRDVEQQVESFHFMLESGRIDGAARQLQQAFVMGEYLPAVQAVPRTDKIQIQDYARNTFQLVNSMEVKDFTLAEELVTKMREQASDFDYSKPTAAIETAKITSNMRIRTAKNAALKGDEQAYEENIKAAAMIWPTNPQLKEQFNLIADSADVQEQAKLEFDRLLSTQSYRQIYTNKARFIAATVEDPERQAALNQIVENILLIETSMKQADTLLNAGQSYAAWEIVEETFQQFPDDVPLSAKRSDLSTEVAEFVRALKTAENLEENQKGSSLTWYLAARRYYPQSKFAKDGIDRLVNEILPDESAAPPAPLPPSDLPPLPSTGDPIGF